MSLFSYEEVCEGCIHSNYHDCCGSFCYCSINKNIDHIGGQCDYQEEENE